jgi:hypothetical protein
MINNVKRSEKCGLCYARDFSPYAWLVAIVLMGDKLFPDLIVLTTFILIPFMIAPFISDVHIGGD